ncbi:hypothetical protein [Psychrobacillus sp. OK032]|nr:hypothetical protein [Psychrobacillus sp. OK032]
MLIGVIKFKEFVHHGLLAVTMYFIQKENIPRHFREMFLLLYYSTKD